MVSRAADYALRVALVLAGRPPGTRMSLVELSSECDVPPAYLYKVVRTLAERGVLTAHRGKRGGYELAPEARDLSVLQVVDALDGLPVLNTCLLADGCHRAVTCSAHPVWVRAQAAMREVLASARISDLAHGLPPDGPAALPRLGQRHLQAPCRRASPARDRDERAPRALHRHRMGDR